MRNSDLGLLTKSMPLSAPTSDVVFNCYLYGNRIFRGITKHKVTGLQWSQMQTVVSGITFIIIKDSGRLIQGKKNLDFLLTFTSATRVNSEGSIKIYFDDSQI